MKTNKYFRLLTSVTGGLAFSVLATSAMANVGVEYALKLAEDKKTYQVWMKANSTPKPNISLTGQVTIKVPHSNHFKVNELKTAIKGANWVEASRVDAPAEDKAHDYISFSFVGLQGNSAHNFSWEAEKEQLAFTFENTTGCVSGVSLMDNNDPFNIADNSANTNPGNQFTNLGWGSVSDNHYIGNYSSTITCTP